MGAFFLHSLNDASPVLKNHLKSKAGERPQR